jgi:hypothetical protein
MNIFLDGGAHGNAAIVASMDIKCSRGTTVRSSGLVGCSSLLGAPGTAQIRRLTVLYLSRAAFPKTVPCLVLFFKPACYCKFIYRSRGHKCIACWPSTHKNPFRVPAPALELIHRPKT